MNLMRYLLFLGLWISVLQAQNITDASGKKQGMWRVTWPNLAPKTEGLYKDNVRMGLWHFYREDSTLLMQAEYMEKGKAANVKYFHRNGLKSAEGLYKGQKKHGTWYFYPVWGDSLPVLKENYVQGLRQGDAERYFPGGGVYERFTYQQGKKEGKWVQYHTNGAVRTLGNFVADQLQGPIQVFGDNGRKRLDGFYKDGARHGVFSYFDANGKLTQTIRYNMGAIHKDDLPKLADPEPKMFISEQQFQQMIDQQLNGLQGGYE